MSYQTQEITMKTKTNKQNKPKWFHGAWYKTGDIVTNPFSGEMYELTGPELSMYDFIMGATITSEMGIFNTPHHIQELRKGLDWFRKNNPEAYMVLLD